MTIRTGWVTLVLAAWLSSCGTPPVVAESQEVALEGWDSEDVLRFQWDMDDTLSRHDLMLDVRHAQDYPYSNLYLFLTYRFPNGKSRTDTVDCTLADELGRWRGSGFGDLVDQRFLIQQGIQFPLKGRYFLEVTHGMRSDPMTDISDVGIRLERP